MTGHGGWPLTAFLDPEGVPFYGGTYFPPEPRQGMPSLRMVMEAVVESWSTQRERIRASAARIREQLGAIGRIEPSARSRQRRDRSTPRSSGCGRWPTCATAASAGRRSSRPPRRSSCCSPAGVTDVVEVTLDAMAHGGIYDQVGGGFARYSVDDVWLVPHFEKMLYDNALLARAYLHGWQALGHERWRRVCEETLVWALREMRGPGGRVPLRARRRLRGRGGAVLRLDAGRDPRGARGGRPRRRCRRGDRLLRGHPRRATSRAATSSTSRGARAPSRPTGLDEARRALYTHRSRRVWPGKDDKRLTSWNALMIARPGRGGRRPALRRLPGRRGRLRRVRLARPARRARPPAAHLQGRRGAARRLPRGLRVPGRGAADAVRGDLRRAVVRRRARDGRPDDRAVRRPRARRVLHHRPRPRAADRAPQGRRRPPDPVRELLGGLRAAAPRRADRRARVRAPRRRRLPAPAPGRRAPPAGARAPAARDGLPLRAGQGGGAGGPGRQATASASSRRSCAPASGPTSCSPAAPRAPSAPS